MRVRNIWFGLSGFVAAALMAFGAACFIWEYMRNGNASIISTLVGAGLLLLLAVLYVRISLQVGDYEKRSRELRRRKKTHEGNNNSTEKE
jgi:hypothetical protein